MSSVEAGQMSAVETGQMSVAESGQMPAVETRHMSSVETGQMSAAETGQMSAVETGQMSAVETGQIMSSVARADICLVSIHNGEVSEVSIAPISQCSSLRRLNCPKTTMFRSQMFQFWQ